MTVRLITLVPQGRRCLRLYGINSLGAFAQLAEAHSWQAALKQIRAFVAMWRPLSLVVAGTTPYDDFLSDALLPVLDVLVLIPDPWLGPTPLHQAKARARRAARLATAHFQQRIDIRYGLADEVPF